MIRFSWHAESVDDRIHAIRDLNDKRKAKKALKYLVNCRDSSYAHFYEMHHKFLQKNPNADARQRKRWLRMIEEEGIETALWPHLFWRTDMCFTWVRLHQPVRRDRRLSVTMEQALEGNPLQEDDEEAGYEDAC